MYHRNKNNIVLLPVSLFIILIISIGYILVFGTITDIIKTNYDGGVNDAIKTILTTMSPKYYPRVISLDDAKLVYDVYTYPDEKIVGERHVLNLYDVTTGNPIRYKFDWDTGIMNVINVNKLRDGDVTVTNGILTIKGKSTKLIEPDVSTMLENECVNGSTFPRPLIGSGINNMNQLIAIDGLLNERWIPGVNEQGLSLNEYGVCVNGTPEWKTCEKSDVYIGSGKCLYVDFSVHRCMNHIAETPGMILEIPDADNECTYIRCVDTYPYAKRYECPLFMIHDGTSCKHVNWCEPNKASVPIPIKFRTNPMYMNSFVSCVNPSDPKLITCKLGLANDLVSCNNGTVYEYVNEPESFELKSFRICRREIDVATGTVVSEKRARMKMAKEYIYKSVDRESPKYSKQFDMYIEYQIPEFYFSDLTGEYIECKTFRDCHSIFKRNGLRVYSAALKTYLKFCALSVSVKIDINHIIDTNVDLSVSYSIPSVLTEIEFKTIQQIQTIYKDEPVYASSARFKNNLYEYDPVKIEFFETTRLPRIRENYGYISNTFYAERTHDTRVAILKNVSDVTDRVQTIAVIQGDVKFSENSFGYTFRKEITPSGILGKMEIDKDCTSLDKKLQDIIRNVENSVVINNSVPGQYFCINGRKTNDNNLPCNKLLGLKLNKAKTNCVGLENVGPPWVNFVNENNPKNNTYNVITKRFNEQNINANTEQNNLLISLEEYNNILNENK